MNLTLSLDPVGIFSHYHYHYLIWALFPGRRLPRWFSHQHVLATIVESIHCTDFPHQRFWAHASAEMDDCTVLTLTMTA